MTYVRHLDLPVSKHCKEVGHSEWDTIIDSVTPLKRGGDRLTLLKRKELPWIYKLDTLKLKGLNVELKTNVKMIR